MKVQAISWGYLARRDMSELNKRIEELFGTGENKIVQNFDTQLGAVLFAIGRNGGEVWDTQSKSWVAV